MDGRRKAWKMEGGVVIVACRLQSDLLTVCYVMLVDLEKKKKEDGQQSDDRVPCYTFVPVPNNSSLVV